MVRIWAPPLFLYTFSIQPNMPIPNFLRRSLTLFKSGIHIIPSASLFVPILLAILVHMSRNIPLVLLFEQIDSIERAGRLQFQPRRDALEVVDVRGVAGESNHERVRVFFFRMAREVLVAYERRRKMLKGREGGRRRIREADEERKGGAYRQERRAHKWGSYRSVLANFWTPSRVLCRFAQRNPSQRRFSPCFRKEKEKKMHQQSPRLRTLLPTLVAISTEFPFSPGSPVLAPRSQYRPLLPPNASPPCPPSNIFKSAGRELRPTVQKFLAHTLHGLWRIPRIPHQRLH